MTTAKLIENPEEEQTDTTISPKVSQQLKEVVKKAERALQMDELPAPHWRYTVPCAGVRYYRY